MKSSASATSPTEVLAGSAPRRDKNGYLVIGNPERGCPFCGSISVHASEVGNVAWYHPSTECCERAVTRQIQWRSDELRAVQKERDADERAVAEQERRAADSYGGEGARAQARLSGMRRGVAAKEAGFYGPRVKELAGEIARLKRKRDALGATR